MSEKYALPLVGGTKSHLYMLKNNVIYQFLHLFNTLKHAGKQNHMLDNQKTHLSDPKYRVNRY